MPTMAGPDFGAALKIAYLDPLNNNIFRQKVLLDRLEKNNEDVSGKFAYMSLISGRNQSPGSRSDVAGTGPILPEAGNQTYTQATFPMTYHYGRARVSGPVIRQSKDKKFAFAKALDTEMEGLKDSLPEDLNRQLWGYGHGRAATLGAGAVTASTSVSVANGAIFQAKVGNRIHFLNITSGALTGTTALFVGSIDRDITATLHRINIVDSAGTATQIGGQVTSTIHAIYFGTGATLQSQLQTSRANDMFGIPSLVDDGAMAADEAVIAGAAAEFAGASLNYGGIDRSTAGGAFWRCQKMQNPASAGTNRPLTNGLLMEMYLRATGVGGAKDSNIEFYTNLGLWMTWGLLHIGDRRYIDYQKKSEMGWLMIEYNGRPVFADRDAPRDHIYCLDMSTIAFLTQSDYMFLDEDGGIIRHVADTDSWEMALVRDCQLGARNCQRHVDLDDVSVAANIEANL